MEKQHATENYSRGSGVVCFEVFITTPPAASLPPPLTQGRLLLVDRSLFGEA